jgi:hypothetical protein
MYNISMIKMFYYKTKTKNILYMSYYEYDDTEENVDFYIN